MDYQMTFSGKLAGDAPGPNLEGGRFWTDVAGTLAEWCADANVEGEAGGDITAELTLGATSPTEALTRAEAVLDQVLRRYGVDPRAYIEWRQVTATRQLVPAGATSTATGTTTTGSTTSGTGQT